MLKFPLLCWALAALLHSGVAQLTTKTKSVQGNPHVVRCDEDSMMTDDELGENGVVMLLKPVLTESIIGCSFKMQAQENTSWDFQCMDDMVTQNHDIFAVNGKMLLADAAKDKTTVESTELNVEFESSQCSWNFNRHFACIISRTDEQTGIMKPPCTCGIANNKRMRVIGGGNAATNELVWQVELVTKDGTHLCGGAVVSPSHVLTAARCLQRPDDLTLYKIETGAYHSDDPRNFMDIKKITVHENYNYFGVFNYDYDIAVLELAIPFDFEEPNIGAVCLPTLGEDHTDKTVTISGWGANSTSGMMMYPTELQKAELEVMANDVCDSKLDAEARPWDTTDRMVCAQSPTRGTCYGDFGGPMTYNEEGHHELVGISSWTSSQYCDDDHISGFTRIANPEMYAWIMEHTEATEVCEQDD